MKMYVVFEKKPRLRHIGHLDLMRAMQRALRRSGLPVCFSKGFNPHLLLSFAAPLSVGMAGLREVMEVPLSSPVSEAEFLQKINRALPPELPCIGVRAVDDQHAAPMALLQAATFEIVFEEQAAPMLATVPSLLQKQEIICIRKTKSGEKPCNIRPMIYNLVVADEKTLRCTLALCESATCKPDLLLEALAREAGLESKPRVMMTRTQLLGDAFAPLETL